MIRTALDSVWSAWAGDRSKRAARAAVVAAAGTLGLSAAGTVEVTFTLQPTYALLAIAVGVGAPAVLVGWMALPRHVQAAAAFLVVAYILATLLGHPADLKSQRRGGSGRSLVYIFDLLLGLGIVGLLTTLWTPRFARQLLLTLVMGAGLTASYAVYQWFAQHFGWPLADINSAPNSDGFTRGHSWQGTGLLGWERARGTFKEPLYLGIFCAMTLPLALVSCALFRGRNRRLALLGTSLLCVALVSTASSLSWGILAATGLGVGLLVGVRDARPTASTVLASVSLATVLFGPVLLLDPSALAGATGRSERDLRLTSQNRQLAWEQATNVWSMRPVLGYGPGQSSVRLAYRPDPVAVGRTSPPVVLGSAQGVWAASLVDAGVVGFVAWPMLLCAFLALGVRAAWRDRDGKLSIGLLAAASVATAGGQLSGDRLDVRAWLLLGVLVAAASSQFAARDPGEADQDAEKRPAAGP